MTRCDSLCLSMCACVLGFLGLFLLVLGFCSLLGFVFFHDSTSSLLPLLQDGHYWITGRVDDVINVSGHRLGSADIESALVEHKGAEAAAFLCFTSFPSSIFLLALKTLEES